MRGVLGGFKNMLRQWRMNYLRNKKKKQQEIEAGKLTKYYTLKRILYSGLAIACYPFSLFPSSPSKKITEEFPELLFIQQSVATIQKQSLQLPKKQKIKEIQSIEKQIQKLEKKIKKTLPSKDFVFQKEVQETLQQIKKEMSNLKNPLPFRTTTLRINNDIKNSSLDLALNSSKKANIGHEDKPMKAVFSPLAKTSKVKLIDPKMEKEKVKKLTENIAKLNHKISTTQEYSLFYDHERKLKDCKTQLEEMLDGLEKAQLMKNLSELEAKERKKPIIDLLEEVKKLEVVIQNKKEQIYKNTPSSSIKKEENKREEKKKVEEQKKTQPTISEWQQAQMIILKQIEQQQKQLSQFEQKRDKLGKKGLLQTLSNFASHAIGLLVAFSPFALFKNKLLGTLATSIMVNNSLKSMKKLLHPKEQTNYEWLGQELKEKQAILQNIYRVSTDSLYQIDSMKEEMKVLLKSNPENIEILSFIQQLEVIERETVIINERVKHEGKIIDKQYTKVFTK